MKLLGLSGSLRVGSLNQIALHTLDSLGYPIDVFDYGDVPLYDPNAKIKPAAVARLVAAIESADALIIATPEYNYSIPGVLKNALDWASRPAYQSPFRGKPVAVLSATTSPLGGVRAQQHLKTILLGMVAQVFPWPELAIGNGEAKVSDGLVKEPEAVARLDAFATAFTEWVQTIPSHIG